MAMQLQQKSNVTEVYENADFMSIINDIGEEKHLQNLQSIVEEGDSSFRSSVILQEISKHPLFAERDNTYKKVLSMVLMNPAPISEILKAIQKDFSGDYDAAALYISSLPKEEFSVIYSENSDRQPVFLLKTAFSMGEADKTALKARYISPLINPSKSVNPYSGIPFSVVKHYETPDRYLELFEFETALPKSMLEAHDVLVIQNNVKLKFVLSSLFEDKTNMPINTKKSYKASSENLMSTLSVLSNGEFYLAHSYDHRGRHYARGYQLNYQGTDFNKASIEFANKEIIPV